MYYNLIKANISRLDSNTTMKFLNNNNINVNYEESSFLTDLAKEYWEDLYNKKYSDVFNIMSKKINIKTCNDIKNLYFKIIKQYLD